MDKENISECILGGKKSSENSKIPTEVRQVGQVSQTIIMDPSLLWSSNNWGQNEATSKCLRSIHDGLLGVVWRSSEVEKQCGNSRFRKAMIHGLKVQFWEFDPYLGTSEEIAEVENYRNEFTKNRFRIKHSSDLLMRFQFARENPCEKMELSMVKVESEEEITTEVVDTTLRRALQFYSTLQSEDGFWPGDYGGPLFLLPGLVGS
ncbi:unnamed protein product [Dovyalis caffra]|uniref:Cycloartenol synthase n=1 Tax=Dovyalis caffra TaxID=77055 RepID=A0AAV1S608_9ROSI|nr:unnamed protein product [Dovyalis caffra]